ncbi:hypothetical protein COHA_001495 [Chlorella ohadii]|uniref:Uncharacterized protein n=1 Tax=Chlorella ohadii TaxID=2649997 RepID=A0AAD5DXJ0_9CHLO|nr:hypothetical protein COHA_001495 [Chlorella ohadii]
MKKKAVFVHPWFGDGKASASAAASAETVLYLNNTTPVMWTDGEAFVCVCPIKPEELVITKKLPDVKIAEVAAVKHPLLAAKALPCASAAGCSGGSASSASADASSDSAADATTPGYAGK